MMRALSAASAALVVTAVGVLVGCSDQTSPESEDLQDVSYAFADDQLATSAAAGADIDGSAGVFSIGWREFMLPQDGSSTIVGDALAVVFDGSQGAEAPLRTRAGVDIGTVTLRYADTTSELAKKEGWKKGVFYSLFPHPHHRGLRDLAPSTCLEFVGGATYEFEVTGSEAFSAGTIAITAPPSLLSITSHTDGQQVDLGSDLVLAWEGGQPDGAVAIRVSTRLPDPQAGDPRKCGHGGPHQGPLTIPQGFVVTLAGNPGTATLPASDIRALLDTEGGSAFSVMVLQLNEGTFEHDGKSFRTLLRNGDRVLLHVP
jgi:hypothetical protein